MVMFAAVEKIDEKGLVDLINEGKAKIVLKWDKDDIELVSKEQFNSLFKQAKATTELSTEGTQTRVFSSALVASALGPEWKCKPIGGGQCSCTIPGTASVITMPCS